MGSILILGCGDVGSTFAKILAEKGHTVWGAKRNPSSLPSSISPLTLDVTLPHTFSVIPDGIDKVIYCLAPSERTENAYQQTYVEGLKNTIAFFESKTQKPSRLFFVSSTAVYGQTDGSWVDETSETVPEHFTGRIQVKAEQTATQSKIPSTVVRLAGVYGPGRFRLIEKALTAPHEDQNTLQFTNRIHRDDCAGTIAHLCDMKNLKPLYLAVDNEPAPLHEVLEWIRSTLQRFDSSFFNSCSSTMEKKIELKSRNGTNKRCKNQRLLKSGYALKFPTFKEGYTPIIQEYLKQKR